MNFNLGNLENYLSEKFNFSLVSIITKGNSLIISVKESLPDLEDSYVPITSDYNMVINSITTYSGTQKVSVGDIVYKGDVIVEPYVEKNGDRVYVSPCADITATIFFSKSYKFLKSEEIFKRTGEKCLISSNVSLGRWNIIHSEKDNPFTNYEIEETSNTISQYFLPISINKIYAYELTLVTIEHDFDLEKDGIIKDLKNSVYSQLGNYEVSNENTIITKIDGGYIINYNVESVIQLKYQYYN